MKDARGVERGRCKNCPHCAEFTSSDPQEGQPVSVRCVQCNCPPAAHENRSTRQAWTEESSSEVGERLPGDLSARSLCSHPGCSQRTRVDFDPNSGIFEYSYYCSDHLPVVSPTLSADKSPLYVQDVESETMQYGQERKEVLWMPAQDGFILPSADTIPLHRAVGTGVESQPSERPSNMDSRGALRGHCTTAGCSCGCYSTDGSTIKCAKCDHPPGKHTNLSRPIPKQPADPPSHPASPFVLLPQQQQYQMYPVAPIPYIPEQQLQPVQLALPPTQVAPIASGVPKCAIPECPNPCYVDDSGTVHECCGYTHAMERQRRLAIQQQQQVIKGVTHCLLPECSNPTWPFQNYCGRTHANIGGQRGLKPPSPAVDPNATTTTQQKDSSLCILPGCSKPKFVEKGVTHPYCGKSHAQLAKTMNIVPTADKVEDQCELPGCNQPKRREANRVHDYCCLAHANQDAPNRDARMVTSLAEAQKFLDQFKGKLNVVSIYENPDAKPPTGQLFLRYKQKMLSLPKDQRKTCLAFHGTSENNVQSICKNGYDPKLRSGQAYGPGEYFATTPDISLGYCKGGRKMLLNELLLGKDGTHHTKSGTIVVMKDPAHDLPRFVITFK